MFPKPSESTDLFGMNRHFNEITRLYNKGNMPNKILLSGKKGLGKSTLAYHIINYILSLNEDHKYDLNNCKIHEENKSYKLVQNYSHPNFYLIDLIDNKKNIDVAQIREMITYTNKSSFNNTPRFILIDNIENLNKNSVNALLKIIEDPNDKIFFILINNNEKKVLPTLKSRCLTFKINFTFEETIDVTNKLLKKNIFEIINTDILNYYITPGEIINLVLLSEDKGIDLKKISLSELLKVLIDNHHYKKNKLIKNFIINFIELFFLKEYMINKSKKNIFYFYQIFIYKIHNVEKFNLDEESLFLEFKFKLLNE
tara:strand:+ start:2585 stop:3523 length:939 start_codon:yes stop_codon:yes gene_type:complete